MPSLVEPVSSPHLPAMCPAVSTLAIPPLTQDTATMKKNRCAVSGCKRKLTLTDFPCRCGKIHCPTHRFSDDHGCTYDYKKDAKQELLKTMSSAVVGVKVEKI